MNFDEHSGVRETIDRLGRILASDEWIDEINPTQWTALSYLARANRFSRSPSQVAEYMESTRGTVSQTLKSLAKKGLIVESRSQKDKRSISYSPTEKGLSVLQRNNSIDDAVSSIGSEERSELLAKLEEIIRLTLKQRGGRPFGVCQSCKHHQVKAGAHFCSLLNEPLSVSEASQICHEHEIE